MTGTLTVGIKSQKGTGLHAIQTPAKPSGSLLTSAV